MNDLISSSFKRYTDLNHQVQLDDIESQNASLDSGNLDEFFGYVESVKEDMKAVDEIHKRLQDANEESKTVHDSKAVKKLRARMDSSVTEVLKRVKMIKTKLVALEKSNAAQRKVPGCGPGSSADRTRTSVVSGLGKKLKDMMDDFQRLRTKMASEYKETVERRYFSSSSSSFCVHFRVYYDSTNINLSCFTRKVYLEGFRLGMLVCVIRFNINFTEIKFGSVQLVRFLKIYQFFYFGYIFI